MLSSANISDRDIIISRTVKAPRNKVWKAWATLEHLEQWWGPNGFTITTESYDFRIGGAWKFVMRGPDGRDYEEHIVFTNIEEPSCISHNHGGAEGDIGFISTITFEEMGDETVVTMHAVFQTAEERDRVVKEHGAIEGGKQTLSKMAEYVEAM